MFEKHPVTDSGCSHFYYIDVEALVILHCYPNVETCFSVCVPCCSVFGFYVHHHCAAQGGKWVLHVIVLPMYMHVCNNFGSDVALS